MHIHESSKTKMIATIGPSTEGEEKLRELIISGIDICRLNFSHGNYKTHLEVINRLRKLNGEMGTHVALLADLQGPKIRLGEMSEEGCLLKAGEKIRITNKICPGTKEKVYISYPQLPEDVRVGDAILIDDGRIKLRVVSSDSESEIIALTIHGGALYSRKGVNLPDTRISSPCLTEKDIEDLEFILEHDFDWIALSFVRWASDITTLKKIIKSHHKAALVVAKIEKPEAMKEIDQIIKESDAVMVARGDLGVEVSFDKVPYFQKMIVKKSIRQSTPVIIATQMLESMIDNFRPTRAEANDVANAVFDCADTVMLSGETSVGNYPIEAIQSMQMIIDFSEDSEYVYAPENLPDENSTSYIPDSVCFNACKMADQSGARAIVAFAAKAQTLFRLASNRPNAPVFAFTTDTKLMQQLSMVWGVRTFYMDPGKDAEHAFRFSIKTLKRKGLIADGDIIVHVSSLPVFDHEGVNTIKLSYV